MNTSSKQIARFILKKHKKICFMPYKYEMWECMSGIYEELKKQGAKPVVMPIPYFRLKDGCIDMTGGLISDREKYRFRTKDWKKFNEYDFDCVFIHNPYDDNNTITTIHPFFYSSELKKRGCKIAYVPYFIHYGGVSTEDFRLQSGVANADYIFVHSDQERQAYIDTYKKIGMDFSNRVFNFGSPFTDKLKKSGNNTLICTSIIAFLSNPEYKLSVYREKIETANNPIFRPHPLMIEIINARCPERLSEWLKLTENAPLSTNKLKDDINSSNKLISDPSSVVEIWKTTGKPFEII